MTLSPDLCFVPSVSVSLYLSSLLSLYLSLSLYLPRFLCIPLSLSFNLLLCVYLYVSLSLLSLSISPCLTVSLPLSVSLSVPFGCLSLSSLVFLCVYMPMSLPSPSIAFLPGWPPFVAFSSCQWLSRAGAPEAASGGPGRGLGTSSRGRAAPAHHHRRCLCLAGSLHRGGGPLWAKATQRPCHSCHRATIPKARGWHLPRPLAHAGPSGQSCRRPAGTSGP